MGVNYPRIPAKGTGVRASSTGCLRQEGNFAGRHPAHTSHSWQPPVSAERGWAATDQWTLPAFKWDLSLSGWGRATYGKTSLFLPSFRISYMMQDRRLLPRVVPDLFEALPVEPMA